MGLSDFFDGVAAMAMLAFTPTGGDEDDEDEDITEEETDEGQGEDEPTYVGFFNRRSNEPLDLEGLFPARPPEAPPRSDTPSDNGSGSAPPDNMPEITGRALNHLRTLYQGPALYAVLSQSLGMRDHEIMAAGFAELEPFMGPRAGDDVSQ